MPQQRGPFILQPDSLLIVAPGKYDFTSQAQDLGGELDDAIAALDSFDAVASNHAAEPIENLIALDFDGIAAELEVQQAAVSLPYLDDLDAGFAEAAGQLNGAIAFAPTQAWTDPGGAYVPPDSVLTLKVPTVDPETFKPAQNFQVGQYTGGQNPAIALFNSTRIGSVNFFVGDVYDVVGLGKLGDVVSVRATLNGSLLPDVTFDPMDSSGQFFLHGTMAPEQVGAWHQDWYIDGQLLGSFNFLVAPSDA